MHLIIRRHWKDSVGESDGRLGIIFEYQAQRFLKYLGKRVVLTYEDIEELERIVEKTAKGYFLEEGRRAVKGAKNSIYNPNTLEVYIQVFDKEI